MAFAASKAVVAISMLERNDARCECAERPHRTLQQGQFDARIKLRTELLSSRRFWMKRLRLNHEVDCRIPITIQRKNLKSIASTSSWRRVGQIGIRRKERNVYLGLFVLKELPQLSSENFFGSAYYLSPILTNTLQSWGGGD